MELIETGMKHSAIWSVVPATLSEDRIEQICEEFRQFCRRSTSPKMRVTLLAIDLYRQAPDDMLTTSEESLHRMLESHAVWEDSTAGENRRGIVRRTLKSSNDGMEKIVRYEAGEREPWSEPPQDTGE